MSKKLKKLEDGQAVRAFEKLAKNLLRIAQQLERRAKKRSKKKRGKK